MANKSRMLINAAHPEECRAVIIEDGKIEEFIAEHSSQELIKGNVYLGVITRVEPSIEAAFVDFGGKKFGFLPFKEVLRESYQQTREKKAKVRIQDVLVRGQKILVQVIKESRDLKGPTLSNAVTIPGRFLVLMKGSDSSGVSRKIEEEEERKKLKSIVAGLNIPAGMGIIVRTAGLGRTKNELQKDIQMLLKIWNTIENGVKKISEAPALIHSGPGMVVRTVRDHFTTDTSEIIVDDKESYKELKDFMQLVMPRMKNRVKLYQETKPLFSQHNIEDQIESIYHRRVELPSGGSIVIDVGEAMVSIDVNSGKTKGASQLEETAFKANTEAAREIARQLRLRDLGGLVVIDFIDMFQKKHKSQVEKEFKQSCKKDKARINLSRISRFGLLELSRQRLSPPVKESSFVTCTHCEGSGQVKSDNASALSVLRKIQDMVSISDAKVIAIKVSHQIANYLFNNKMKFLLDLQEKHFVKLDLSSEEDLPYSEFSYSIVEKKTEEDKTQEDKTQEDKTQEDKTQEDKVKTASKDQHSETRETSEDGQAPKSRNQRRPPRTGAGKKHSRRRTGGRRPGPKRSSRTWPSQPQKTPTPIDGNVAAESSEANGNVTQEVKPAETENRPVQPTEDIGNSIVEKEISPPPAFPKNDSEPKDEKPQVDLESAS